jgi:hypothetical protein
MPGLMRVREESPATTCIPLSLVFPQFTPLKLYPPGLASCSPAYSLVAKRLGVLWAGYDLCVPPAVLSGS